MTCSKNPEDPSCIDLQYTGNFQNTTTLGSG